jgi:rhamnosyltransferase subunit B
MRLILTALGSYGDVHPMVGLGAAMRRRGHQVFIIANPHFRSVVESAQLQLLPIGTQQEYDELAHHRDLWHPFRGPKMILQMCMVNLLRGLYGLIKTHYVAGETVLGAHPLDIASRIFQEQVDAPLASIHYSPIGLRSMWESPQMFGMWLGQSAPGWVKRIQFWLGDRYLIDRWLRPEVNDFRWELGLPPIQRVLYRWCFSPRRVIGLFPDWFAAPQPDWPAKTALAGFPLWDQAANGPSATVGLSDEMLQFLDDGDAPIVFSPGSAMTEGHAFFVAAVEACQRLGRRGILLTGYPEHLPKELPPEVRYFGFVPFSSLLPRAAAFVHHGGIGSSSQGLVSGRPQLLMPMAYDQLDNAVRLHRLGVGTYLRRRQFRGPAVASHLEKLLASKQTSQQCDQWAQRCDGQASLEIACELLEELKSL